METICGWYDTAISRLFQIRQLTYFVFPGVSDSSTVPGPNALAISWIDESGNPAPAPAAAPAAQVPIAA